MIVGNIINCNDEINSKYFNCLTIEEFLSGGPTELPTLIVGWDVVKNNFGEVSILSKTIYPPTGDGFAGCYWTFSKAEKRGIYEENLKEYKERCYTDLIKNIKTYNIDPIIYNINNTDDLCSKIMKLAGGIGYLFQDRIVYVYKNNDIFMLDLELIEYINFDKDQIVNVLKDNLSVFGDDFEENYIEELKHLNIKYIPYLVYKNGI